ncbi:PASTA domain-containing protein [Streptomyces sp. NPDC048483]|uniref:PASTA domain-containing protein n=1 Tax=Streptomyces sp. NPDC048483 TaxID=3154927 RepID=UPI00341C8B8C
MTVPNVTGQNLAVAESRLASAGINYSHHPADGRLFIAVPADWTVSRQGTEPGTYCIDGPGQGLNLYAVKN